MEWGVMARLRRDICDRFARFLDYFESFALLRQLMARHVYLFAFGRA